MNWMDEYNRTGTFSSFAGSQNSGISQLQEPKIPSWLTDPGTSDLLDQYHGIAGATQNAINPLRGAAQESIAFNTGAGGQAANSAAREYAQRIGQAGGSASGAGVVKAQALLPVLQQNSDIRSKEADTEAQYKFNALKLSTDVATSLAQLRTNYAKTLADYVTTRHGQDISQTQGNQDYLLKLRSLNQQQQEQQKQDHVDAAKALLATKQPFASFTRSNAGQITEGLDSYNAYQTDQQQRAQAKAYLAGLF